MVKVSGLNYGKEIRARRRSKVKSKPLKTIFLSIFPRLFSRVKTRSFEKEKVEVEKEEEEEDEEGGVRRDRVSRGRNGGRARLARGSKEELSGLACPGFGPAGEERLTACK